MSKSIPAKRVLSEFFSKLNNSNNKVLKMQSSIDLNQMKRIFAREARLFYREKRNREFQVDTDNKKYFNQICKYFSRDSLFEIDHEGDLNKGLFVYGNSGSGKTTSFKIIQSISQKYNLKQLWFPFIETQEVVNKFNSDKNKDSIIKNYSKGNFMFDELGAETTAQNVFVFGKEDIFIRILEARYNQFVDKGVKTHITCNLTLEEIRKRYGPRVEDRFYEMFNLVPLNVTGKSRR
ncbi:MAG: hypothetical protein ABJN95_17025 [Maribacter sp.]|uniref:hypothetical protein n=1 Tax=Maribacter sp. TaxID=1897614 RepID=UPI003299A9BF